MHVYCVGGVCTRKCYVGVMSMYCVSCYLLNIKILPSLSSPICSPPPSPPFSYKDPKNASCPPSNSDIKHLKVLRQNSKYGFSVPCSHKSLEDLVLHYSERSLGVHNHGLDTTLQAPINANNPWPVPP